MIDAQMLDSVDAQPVSCNAWRKACDSRGRSPTSAFHADAGIAPSESMMRSEGPAMRELRYECDCRV